MLKFRFSTSERHVLQLLKEALAKHRILFAITLVLQSLVAVLDVSSIAILGLAINLFTQTGIDNSLLASLPAPIYSLLQDQPKNVVVIALIGGALFAQAMKSVVTYGGVISLAKLTQSVRTDFSVKISRQIFSLSYLEITRRTSGWMSAMFTSANSFSGLIRALMSMVLIISMIIGYLCLMIWINPTLTGFALILGIVLVILVKMLSEKLRSIASAIAKGEPAVLRTVVGYMQSPRLIRAFGITAELDREVRSEYSRLYALQSRATIISGLIGPSIEFLAIASIGLLFLALIGFLDGSSNNSLGEFSIALIAAYRIIPHAVKFASTRLIFIRSLPQAVIVADFLDYQEKAYIRNGGVACPQIRSDIKFNSVTFRYPNSRRDALSSVSFSIPKGSIVGIVGPSGSGKTTIADLLCGIIEPTGGSLEVNGYPLRQLDLKEWQAKLGLVDQNSSLLPLSIKQNLSFGDSSITDDKLIAAANAAEISDLVDSFPEGYSTIIGEGGQILSGGERQRLALARALARSPELLILDEATSALDTETEQKIQIALEQLHGRCTILIIAHRLNTLRIADRIIVLENGTIVEQGSLKTLLSNDGVFARVWRAQRGENE